MVDGLDLDALAAFLRSRGARCVTPATARPAQLHAQLIAGGKSNLTYRVTDGVHDWVVRRPPLGHVLATAHDMTREHRVMSRAGRHHRAGPRDGGAVRGPGRDGRAVLRDAVRRGCGAAADGTVAALTDAQRADIAHRLVDTLADLHEMDPGGGGALGLRPPRGLPGAAGPALAAQLERSRTREVPGFPELAAGSPATCREPAREHRPRRLPPRQRPRRRRTSAIRAVLDWEMATLGDPLCDLGLLPVYASPAAGVAGVVSDGMGPHNGFPSMEALVERYAARTGLDVGPLALVRRPRLLQARGDLRGHPRPAPRRPDRRARLRPDRRAGPPARRRRLGPPSAEHRPHHPPTPARSLVRRPGGTHEQHHPAHRHRHRRRPRHRRRHRQAPGRRRPRRRRARPRRVRLRRHGVAITEAGGRAIAVGVDVADPSRSRRRWQRVADELGAPTILVNNAGIIRDNMLFKMTVDDWDAVMNVHLRGSFLMTRGGRRST